VGRKNPNEPFPLLYLSKRSKKLVQVRRDNEDHFSIKPGKRIGRGYLKRNYEFYGVINRDGIVFTYQKFGRVWKKHGIVAAFDPKDKCFVSLKRSEEAIIRELNRMNKGNPELSFYDGGKSLKERIQAIKPDENFEEV
jgi:hypothetical protein